jgi:hypothetical protein
MNRLEINTLLQTSGLSFNVLNEFIHAILSNDFDATQLTVDYDNLSDEDLWEHIDPKFKYAAIEYDNSLGKYQLWYFTTLPTEFCECWDTEDDCMYDRFRLYTTNKPYTESLRNRSV